MVMETLMFLAFAMLVLYTIFHVAKAALRIGLVVLLIIIIVGFFLTNPFASKESLPEEVVPQEIGPLGTSPIKNTLPVTILEKGASYHGGA